MSFLDRIRASRVNQYSQISAPTAGDEPLVVDLIPSPPLPVEQHWIVEHVTFVADLATRAPHAVNGQQPISGLFLCPPGTGIETLAQAVASWNPQARPILLPLADPVISAPAVGARFALSMTMAVGFKITVPGGGWFLRALITCQPGNAAPGPGAGSSGRLTALAMVEDNC